MFFRPTFCAHCGERIERVDWGIMASRRFCQVCESQFKGQDLIPKFVVGISLLIGIFGMGSYLKSGPINADQRVVQARSLVESSSSRTLPSGNRPVNDTANLQVKGQEPPKQAAVPAQTLPRKEQPVVAIAADPVYLCGAQTKKGTPCSRRVKGNVRCFQHTGMPAMVASDKLKIN